jgi:hypothetical protein
MLSEELQNHLQSLRTGRRDQALTVYLDQVSARALIAGLKAAYSVVFQERTVEQKHEIGMSQERKYVLQHSGDEIPAIAAPASLVHCLFISDYHDKVSEITWAGRIQVRNAPGGLALTYGKGYKLDRTVDGWTIKPLRIRNVTLSEELLSARGWKFDALLPFGSPVAISTSA